MKNILVTGAKGFVGRNLVKRLETMPQYYVREFDRGDVIHKQMKGIDYVVHCAGLLYEKEVYDFWYSNVILTRDLLASAVVHKVSKFINIGASVCYGRNDHMITEFDPFKPRTLHEYTKAMAHLLCEEYSKLVGLETYTAIPFSIYGPDDKPRKFFPRLANAIKNDLPITVSKGVAHDWLYIDDFVDGLICMLRTNLEDCNSDRFNFCTQINTTNEEVVALFEKVSGKKFKVTETIPHEYDAPVWFGSNRIAREELGWTPKTSLEEGIALCLSKSP